jgi:butyryl-CoA dehydrogenase
MMNPAMRGACSQLARRGVRALGTAQDFVSALKGLVGHQSRSGTPQQQQVLSEVFAALDKYASLSTKADEPVTTPADLLMGKLPENLNIVRDTTRAWVDKKLKPIAAELDESRRFPRDLVMGDMAKMGLMGVGIPEKWGGAELGYLGYVVALEEVARGCGGTGCCMSVHNSLYLNPISTWGTDAQKEKHLRPFASGEKLGAFALTEPNAGSDAGAMITTAVLDGDYWVINGIKQFITNSPESDAMVVFASIDTSKKHKGITAFIVDNATPGVSVTARERTMGLRACTFGRLAFDNVRIPKDNLIGEIGKGFNYAMMTLDAGRIGIAAQSVGIAQASLECAAKYAHDRVQFGSPIAKLPVIQEKIAHMAQRVEAARLLTWRAAALKDAGLPYSKEAAMAKWTASEAATYNSHTATQVLGGIGYTQDMPVERHYRDARITEIYEGTNEIMRMVVSLAELKEHS